MAPHFEPYLSPRPDLEHTLSLSLSLQVNLGLGMPQDAIVCDRAFNTKETTNAFLGYAAVESVEYDPRCVRCSWRLVLA